MNARVPSSPSPGASEPGASIVTGDRLCTCCGYNLIGQSIVREPTYGLLIIRCPECATAAGVQEYPLLGRWGSRWGAVLAVLWLMFLVGMWPAASGIITGFCIATAEAASRDYGWHLEHLHQEAAGGPSMPAIPGGATVIVQTSGSQFATWWQKQDPATLLADAGGWRGAADWDALLLWVPAFLLTFAVGWFWSGVLVHLRRAWLLVVAALILALSALSVGMGMVGWFVDQPSWYWMAARRQIGPPLAVLTLLFATIPLGLGLAFGRSLTRGLILALLPPRLRGALAVFWVAEGKPPPGVRWHDAGPPTTRPGRSES
jgi:hypothetical protein